MVRRAESSDARELAELMRHLGYDTTESDMEERLTPILSSDQYFTAVQEEQGSLIGMIGMTHSHAYHSNETHVRIIAFVVKEQARGKGAGRQLMVEAERWAESKGATTLILNSGNRKEREGAHEVYQHLEFEGRSTGFYKKLT
ncbi:GNAT family N-acetyltransferase [Halobacillus litoralis]|uniref:GNAT family N-acetyltransferase n=1 Tax=Halobacillus litoralis TaxID=45668 RepID=UPI001CD60D5F|nr:GNAT family N-acetyltransferase [Halobacillus litoralis]MCA0971902.1 GNAT family N-acetyltransferase [Halobacillus litoralis]